MDELQVPTRRLEAEIFTDSGERFSGGLFVTDSPYSSDAIEQLLLVLNDQRTFLPFATEVPPTTPCSILNKTHITRVSFERLILEDEMEANSEGTCHLRLADGSTLVGYLTLDTPLSLSRLLDKFNRAGRFVRFVTDSTIELVQTSYIVRVD